MNSRSFLISSSYVIDYISNSEFKAQRMAQSARASSFKKVTFIIDSLGMPYSLWWSMTTEKFTIGIVKLTRNAQLLGLTAICPESSAGCKWISDKVSYARKSTGLTAIRPLSVWVHSSIPSRLGS